MKLGFLFKYIYNQLFNKNLYLGTPNPEIWPEVKTFPHFKENFP